MTTATRCFAWTDAKGVEHPYETINPADPTQSEGADVHPDDDGTHSDPELEHITRRWPPCSLGGIPAFAGRISLEGRDINDTGVSTLRAIPAEGWPYPFSHVVLTTLEANTPQTRFQLRFQSGARSPIVQYMKDNYNIPIVKTIQDLPCKVATILQDGEHWDLNEYEFSSGEYSGQIYSTDSEPSITHTARVAPPADGKPRIAWAIGFCKLPSTDSLLADSLPDMRERDGDPISEADNRSNWGESVTRHGRAQPNRWRAQRLIVVHTVEMTHGENLNNNKPMLAFLDFQSTRDTNGGYHYAIQARDIWQLARPSDWRVNGACALGTNDDGIHTSFCCYSHNFNLADTTSSAFSPAVRTALLGNHARLLAYLSRDFDIPLVYRTRAEVLQGLHGVTAHGEIQNGPPDDKCKNRTDPGSHFPWTQHLHEAEQHKLTLGLGAAPYRNRGGL